MMTLSPPAPRALASSSLIRQNSELSSRRTASRHCLCSIHGIAFACHTAIWYGCPPWV